MGMGIRWKNAVAVTAVAFGLAAAFAVEAAPCAVLQYEEMKDMTAEELAKEYCTDEKEASDMISEAIERAGFRGRQDEAATEMLHTQIGQCQNERDRIGRVLSRISSTPREDLFKKYCKKG